MMWCTPFTFYIHITLLVYLAFKVLHYSLRDSNQLPMTCALTLISQQVDAAQILTIYIANGTCGGLVVSILDLGSIPLGSTIIFDS